MAQGRKVTVAPLLLGVPEVAAMLGTDVARVRRYIREGTLHAFTLPGTTRPWRFRREEVERFMAAELEPVAETRLAVLE